MTELAIDQLVAAPDGKKFLVKEYLGEGLTARVYKAELQPGGPLVALKVLKPGLSETFVQSFIDEADILSFLRYEEGQLGDGVNFIPGVISRPAKGEADVSFLAMEFVTGESALDLLEHNSRLPEKMVLTIADQVLRVLDLLHTRLRRSYTDFQLRNIWWQADKGQIKLMDWNHVSRPAPEGELPPGVADDLIRLGAFLYQLATGKGAMQAGETAGTLAARVGEDWKKTLSVGMRAIVEQALHPNRERRFATAAEFRAAVQAQLALWNQDEDELHDEAVDAIRAVRNEDAQRDPALVRRAEILVDTLHRRAPTDLTDKWQKELARLTDQVSPAWGSGKQYFRAGLYNEALRLWPAEAQAWGRPDLWRWVILARQAASDVAAYETHGRVYEEALELLVGQHWAEAEHRLSSVPGGPSDDLRHEARAHQVLAQAEAAERDRRWTEAEAAYQRAAKLVASITEDGYRTGVRDVYGLSDLDKKAQAARLRGQQMAADAEAVSQLREAHPNFADFSGGALAGLRANPANLGLLELIAERAVAKELSPNERRELALIGLHFGNPSADVEGNLKDAMKAADQELNEIEARRRQELQDIEARRKADEEERERQREHEIALQHRDAELARQRAEEAQRQAAHRAQQEAAIAQQARDAQTDLRNAFTNRDVNALERAALLVAPDAFPDDIRNGLATSFKSAIQKQQLKEAGRLAGMLERVDQPGHAGRVKELRNLVASDFSDALKGVRGLSLEDAERLKAWLDALDPSGATRRAQEIDRARQKTDNTEQKLRETMTTALLGVAQYLGAAKAARESTPPDVEKAIASQKEAQRELEKVEDDLRRQNRGDLLSSESVAKVRAELQAETKAIRALSEGSPKPDDDGGILARVKEWLRRLWPVLLVAGLILGLAAGIWAGFALDDGGEEVAALIETATAQAAVLLTPSPTVAALPTAAPQPTDPPPTPEVLPTAAPTLEPTVPPSPMPSPTSTALPPLALAPDGRSAAVPGTGSDVNNPAAFFDLPDLALFAPEGWRFRWSGANVELIGPEPTPWTLYLSSQAPDGVVAPPAPVAAVVAGLDNPVDATPTPVGVPAPTENGSVRLSWARQPGATPLPPGDYTFTFSLQDPAGVRREVEAMPLNVRVAPAPPVTVATNELVRELPIWNPTCNINTTPPVGGLQLDVIGKITVPRAATNNSPAREDAIFLWVRLPNSRQTYWLPDTNAVEFNNDQTAWTEILEGVPPVEAPAGECVAGD